MNVARSLPPWLWLVLVALYFVSPVDIFPDFLGLPGRLDDFLVALAGLYYMYTNAGRRRNEKAGGAGPGGARSAESAGDGEGAGAGKAPGRDRQPPDPYAVLGVSRGASFPEIRRRYRERLLEIHPDRVQHLGVEFREMAEQKTRELNEAFHRIQEERKGAG